MSQGTGQEDYSHLPPEQRRKKLQAKLNDISKDIQKEMDQRCLNGLSHTCFHQSCNERQHDTTVYFQILIIIPESVLFLKNGQIV